jgi:ribose 5-phosphate isomerase B
MPRFHKGLILKKLYIASDHAGYDLKTVLFQSAIARKHGFEVVDLGPANSDRVDYPDFSSKVVSAVLKDHSRSKDVSFGLLICGSGQGMAMSANRNKGIRAALAWNEESAKLSRAHNDANVLCLGARLIGAELAGKILDSFLSVQFEGGRHIGRIEKF